MDFLNRLLEIDGIFQSLFGVGIFGAMTILIKMTRGRNDTLMKIVDKQNEMLNRQNGIEERIGHIEDRMGDIEAQAKLRKDALVASLHDRLYGFCTDILNRGCVTIKELDNLEYLWQSYSGLGGNGTGELLYEKVRQLPIVDENELSDNEIQA